MEETLTGNSSSAGLGGGTTMAMVEGAPPKARKYAMYGSLAGTALALLVMAIAGHMVFNLSAEDYLFGDGCGGTPPSASLLSDYVSSQAISDIVGNSSTAPSPSPSGPEYKSKSDGSACESTTECIGVCSGGRCMLSEFGSEGVSSYDSSSYAVRNHIENWTLFDAFCMILLFMLVPIVLTAQRAHFPGVWRVTLCFIMMACATRSFLLLCVLPVLTLRLS